MAFPAPGDAQTVKVRVQVIDLEPFALDLVLPTYIPARDLTQRIARDAGLGAYWEDGTQRAFWLRARGRLLAEQEKLQDLGVVNGELLHLMPQPPAGTPVAERPPEYPPNRGYAAAGWPQLAGSLVSLFAWTIGWTTILTLNEGGLHAVVLGLFPGVGLSLLSTAFARHLWGGDGRSIRIPATGMVVFFAFLIMAYVPAVLIAQTAILAVALAAAPALIGGMFGVTLGWLAWYGAVEPLPKSVTRKAALQAAPQVIACGVCGQGVTPDVRADCVYKCGRVFHAGCYRLRQNAMGPGVCGVCGMRPA